MMILANLDQVLHNKFGNHEWEHFSTVDFFLVLVLKMLKMEM
jgi:hypothetical protein